MLVALGSHRFDITHRAIVIAVVDPAFDPGSEAFLGDAESLAGAGADAVEVVDADEHGDGARTVAAVQMLGDRIGLPVAVRTARNDVAGPCLDAGAVLTGGHGPGTDPARMALVAAAGASVVIRAGSAEQDPAAIAAYLAERARFAERAGIPAERIILDAGAGHELAGATPVERLRGLDALSRGGRPVLVDAASVALAAVGVMRGARILRTRDVRSVRRVAHVTACLLRARAQAPNTREAVS